MLNLEQLKALDKGKQIAILVHALLGQIQYSPKESTVEITDETLVVTTADSVWPPKPDLKATEVTEYKLADIVSIHVFTRNLIQAPLK
jgi:hypothetical protein